MVKRKLVNAGEAQDDDEGGFAPGVAEQITGEGDTLNDSQESGAAVEQADDEQTEADLANVGHNVSEKDEAKRKTREKNAYLKKVDGYGTDHGNGKRSMIALAEETTEAAMHRTIMADDAEMIYDRFKAKADLASKVDGVVITDEARAERSELTKKQKDSRSGQISKLRAFIRLGNSYTNDASDIVRRARDIHLEMGPNSDGVRKGSTYTIMKGIAAEQVDKKWAGVPMTDQQIRDWMTTEKAEAKVKDGWDKVMDALVVARAAQSGANTPTHFRPPVTNVELQNAIDWLRQTLAVLDPARLAKHDADEAAKAAKSNGNGATTPTPAPAVQGAAQPVGDDDSDESAAAE